LIAGAAADEVKNVSRELAAAVSFAVPGIAAAKIIPA
jgi:hypothetical protein